MRQSELNAAQQKDSEIITSLKRQNENLVTQINVLAQNLADAEAEALTDAGEAAREADHRSAYDDSAPSDAKLPAATAARVALRQVGSLLLKALLLVPVIGHLLRDALRGGASAWGYLSLNVALVAALSILIFGLPAFMTVLLGSVVLVFVTLVAITLE